MKKKPKIVIIGATSFIAEHCARLWVKQSAVELILVARNSSNLDRIATDLQVRSPESDIRTIQAEFLGAASIESTVNDISADGNTDIVLIAHGSLPDQTACENDLQSCSDAIEINGISPVLFAEAFAKHMAKANKGTIALIGSVAGDRGRKSNYIYGAAKGLVSRYAQGMQHRFAKTGVNVVLVKPGPTDTPMTKHLKEQGVKLSSVEIVAEQIVDGIDQGKTVIYTPRKWQLIMLIISHIPSFIFNKLNI